MSGLERSHGEGDVLPGQELHGGDVLHQVGVAISVVETDQHRFVVVRVQARIINSLLNLDHMMRNNLGEFLWLSGDHITSHYIL